MLVTQARRKLMMSVTAAAMTASDQVGSVIPKVRVARVLNTLTTTRSEAAPRFALCVYEKMTPVSDHAVDLSDRLLTFVRVPELLRIAIVPEKLT